MIKRLNYLKIAICSLLIVVLLAGFSTVALAQKEVSKYIVSQQEINQAIAVEKWMQQQGTSVIFELQESIDRYKIKMEESIKIGDNETAEKCASLIATTERLIEDYRTYINSLEFQEQKNALTDEDLAYIENLLKLLKKNKDSLS